jgi:hypothetical protein
MSAATIREQQTVDDPPTAPCRVCGHLELGGNDSSDDGEYDSDKSERYCFATPQEFKASALDGCLGCLFVTRVVEGVKDLGNAAGTLEDALEDESWQMEVFEERSPKITTFGYEGERFDIEVYSGGPPGK